MRHPFDLNQRMYGTKRQRDKERPQQTLYLEYADVSERGKACRVCGLQG